MYDFLYTICEYFGLCRITPLLKDMWVLKRYSREAHKITYFFLIVKVLFIGGDFKLLTIEDKTVL